MTYEEKVRYLQRYRVSLKRISVLEMAVQQMESVAERYTAILSPVPGGPGDGKSLPRAVEAILEAKSDLENQIDSCIKIQKEVVDAIQQVKTSYAYEILWRRYILGQRMDRIAEEMHYSDRQVRRIHGNTVNSMEIEKDVR